MRGTRWLILIAIGAVLGTLGLTYRLQKRVLEQQAPAKPRTLPVELSSSAVDWNWTQTSPEGKVAVQIRAKSVQQAKDGSRVDLKDLDLRLFHKEGLEYDWVQSANAVFYPADKRLFSEGDVDITLDVPLDGLPTRPPVKIHSSRASFDTTTGRASTDQPTAFIFENGTGKAVGAWYDPTSRQLHMDSQVELNWNQPDRKPMKLETNELMYLEANSLISLQPWARLTRENSVIEGELTLVTLKDGAIQVVDAQHAHGVDRFPNRQLEYSADHLWVHYGESGEIEKILGRGGCKLVSKSASAESTVTAENVDMEFAPGDGESTLKRVAAGGKAVLESKPLAANGDAAAQARVLRSEMLVLHMRPGGQEMEKLETVAPGRLEFLASRPDHHHRILDAENISIEYGEANRIRSFRAVNAKTETHPSAEESASKRGIMKTQSRNLLAHFDPNTGDMNRLEQWDNFSYEQGDRRARADRAAMDTPSDLITLDSSARLWDASGATSANRIRMDQRKGEFTAEGNVNSTRLPDRKGQGSGMLSGDEPLQALSQHMTSQNRNSAIRYEGNVMLWQGANRLQADRVDIDREKRRLSANGHVVSQLHEERDERKAQEGGFTVVRADQLVYTDEKRLAHYKGGVLLTRNNLRVKSAELQAYLAETGSDSRLEKALADGKVEIVQTQPDRTRTGAGQHGEYYVSEERIVLTGGEPQLTDTLRGTTRGEQLIYFAGDDRLLVNGAPGRPATSRIRRK